ncbi:MAG: hypothetical protein J2P24_08240, partial [Streptosporangiales bacterium]|nr:hypothetical protein [Streptosporangiales bacterium]
ITVSLAAICAVLFVTGVALFVFKVSRKFAPWAFLLAGVGIAGRLSGAQGKITGIMAHGWSVMTGALLGAAVLVGLAIVVGIYLFSKMWKGSGGGAVTCVVAFVFPTILETVGLGVVVGLLSTLLTTAGQAAASLFTGIGG